MSMSKQTKTTIFGILGGLVVMLLIAYLPPVTEMMSRAAWQYLGCFAFMLKECVETLGKFDD